MSNSDVSNSYTSFKCHILKKIIPLTAQFSVSPSAFANDTLSFPSGFYYNFNKYFCSCSPGSQRQWLCLFCNILATVESEKGLAYSRHLIHVLWQNENKANPRTRVSNSGGGLVAKLCLTLVTPWTVDHQAPLSMGFSMQEYWSGLPFPSPGGLPNPGIKPRSLALQADSLPTKLWVRDFFLMLHWLSREPSLKLNIYNLIFSSTFTDLIFYYPSKTWLTLLSLVFFFSSVALKVQKWLCPEGWLSQWKEFEALIPKALNLRPYWTFLFSISFP